MDKVLTTKEKKKEYNRKYRQKNKEKAKEDAKEYYQKNKEKIMEQKRKYYQKNKEKIKEDKRNYHQKNQQNSKYVYSCCKNGAKTRNLEFNLTFEQFMTFWQKPCHYCGSPTKGGLDRMDNAKGYFMDNVVACCWRCNDMKNNMSYKEFINHSKI